MPPKRTTTGRKPSHAQNRPSARGKQDSIDLTEEDGVDVELDPEEEADMSQELKVMEENLKKSMAEDVSVVTTVRDYISANEVSQNNLFFPTYFSILLLMLRLFQAGLRKGQRQQRLEKDFEAQVSALEASVGEKAEKFRQERFVYSLFCLSLSFVMVHGLIAIVFGRARIRETQLAGLAILLKRKADVESQIMQQTRELAEAYLTTRDEVQTVLRGRLDDVDEAMGALERMGERETRSDA
jgi:hypothetical protein